MKRTIVNALAMAAILGGGLTLSSTSSAQSSELQETGPTCGSCTCSDGQECSKGILGGCKCTNPK